MICGVRTIKILFSFEEEREQYKEKYEIKCHKVSSDGFRHGSGILGNLFWFLITLGKTYIYCVYVGEKQIHYSYVMKKCYKFPFLKSNDIHIGPCFTHPDYRGQGIYPAVIQRITTDFGLNSEKGPHGYMIVDEKNVSSIRGVEKAGFKKTGIVEKTGFLKIYKEQRDV